MNEIQLKRVFPIKIDGWQVDICRGSDGLYYATRQSEPAFCLESRSWIGALSKARGAIQFYNQMRA